MDKMIVVGNDIYDEFIREGGYYVDKTELIYELVAKSRNKVTLFTRPRRFGKTLTMSMMESFFDIQRNSADVFAEKKIQVNHPVFCKEWMNQYPVLFLSLKDVEGLRFEDAYGMLEGTISRLCIKFSGLTEEGAVNSADSETFLRLMHKELNLPISILA